MSKRHLSKNAVSAIGEERIARLTELSVSAAK